MGSSVVVCENMRSADLPEHFRWCIRDVTADYTPRPRGYAVCERTFSSVSGYGAAMRIAYPLEQHIFWTGTGMHTPQLLEQRIIPADTATHITLPRQQTSYLQRYRVSLP